MSSEFHLISCQAWSLSIWCSPGWAHEFLGFWCLTSVDKLVLLIFWGILHWSVTLFWTSLLLPNLPILLETAFWASITRSSARLTGVMGLHFAVVRCHCSWVRSAYTAPCIHWMPSGSWRVPLTLGNLCSLLVTTKTPLSSALAILDLRSL